MVREENGILVSESKTQELKKNITKFIEEKNTLFYLTSQYSEVYFFMFMSCLKLNLKTGGDGEWGEEGMLAWSLMFIF